MKLLVVNPNSTPSMTDCTGQTARSVALADTQVVAVNPTAGPASIEGYYDKALSLAGLIETVDEHPDADAIVLGCAGMTSLAKSLTEQHGLPVVDGVASAVVMAEALVRSGAHTSKIGGYAWPLAK